MPADPTTGRHPLVAILRGATPDRAADLGRTLHGAGVRIVEVPLNSPEPFASIRILHDLGLPDCLVGAGTVLTATDVRRTFDAGGRLVVAPNCNDEVIRSALDLGMTVMPGIATATEAFRAVDAGATILKLFPAATYGPGHLKALKTVLPAAVRLYPVGGIGAADIPAWLAAGADGFGFGSEIFRPEYALGDIERRARHLVESLAGARRRSPSSSKQH